MPRGQPRKPVRPVGKQINLPEDIVAKVDLILWSNAQGRVPQGAWQKLVVELLTNWLNERTSNGTAAS